MTHSPFTAEYHNFPTNMASPVRMFTVAVVFGCIFGLFSAQPIELDDSFLSTRGQQPWLVEFYAPWCGHCRKLEPIYHQVYLTLRERGSPVRVAKVDATRYSGVASEFNVKGFPTIKFIHGDVVFSHRGERSRESIMEFAKKALGPRVRPVPNMGKMNDVRSDHSDGVFFMFVGDQDQFGDLATKYAAVAEKFAVLGYFYTGTKTVLPPEFKLKYDPSVVVFKDGTYYEFQQSDEGVTKKELEDFVNGERFNIFPKTTGGSLNEMSEMDKKIVLIVTDEKDKKSKAKQERFKEIARMLITQERKRFHKTYQFTWMGEKETAETITMSTLENPSLFVMDPATQFFYLPPFPLDEMTLQDLGDFLNDVDNEKIQAYGGTGFLQRLKRLFYDIFITMYSLYEQSGWLALLVLGVPVLVLSIVCYALCCMEPFDDTILERGEEEGEGDEQKELVKGEEADCEGEDDMEIEKTDELKKTE